MLADTMGQNRAEKWDGNRSVLGILGDLFNRAETLNFTDQTGAFESETKVRTESKMSLKQRVHKLSVARPGHQIYTRRARTGYIQTATVGRRVDTRG